MSEPLTLRTETGDENVDLTEFEARARRGEISPQSLVRFPPVTHERFVPACELQIFRSLQQPERAHFQRAFGLAHFPWISAGLIVANFLAFFVSARGATLDIDAMVRYGGKVGPLITDLGQVWRLLTANFLHQNPLHIGLNLFLLFNVGGTLENTYRRLDYVWLLIFSGLVTMSTSLLLADAASVGASGMVYGCLGGVVVFGLKYRSILPSRYRRVMVAAIPTVVCLFLLGLTSDGVDNWAHVGGLLAGLLSGLFMRPRLLVQGPRSLANTVVRAVPSVVVLGFVGLGQGLWANALPRMKTERDDAFGISVPLPKNWRRGANRMGRLAYYNGLPSLGRAAFAAEAVDTSDVDHLVAEFVDTSLRPSALGPEVLKVTSEKPVTAQVGNQVATMIRARFDEPSGTTRMVAYFVPRGELVFQLVYTYPEAFPEYERVVELMVRGVRFDEPRALREARAKALLFPNSTWAQGLLGEALRTQGLAEQAVAMLRAAAKRDPANAYVRTELALALFQVGDDEGACAEATAATLYERHNPRALAALAECEFNRGQWSEALSHVTEALRLAPADERLRRIDRKLRSAVGTQQR